jgi:hypothetical protein
MGILQRHDKLQSASHMGIIHSYMHAYILHVPCLVRGHLYQSAMHDKEGLRAGIQGFGPGFGGVLHMPLMQEANIPGTNRSRMHQCTHAWWEAPFTKGIA